MTDPNLPLANETSPDDVILNINRVSGQYLLETSKWGTFLSIMGFILSGLICVFAMFAGSLMSSMMSRPGMIAMPRTMGLLMGAIYFGMGVIYLFPSWYLYSYSQKLKSALRLRDNNALVVAFENQKSLYKFWGIFTIIIGGIYVVLILIMILTLSMIKGSSSSV